MPFILQFVHEPPNKFVLVEDAGPPRAMPSVYWYNLKLKVYRVVARTGLTKPRNRPSSIVVFLEN